MTSLKETRNIRNHLKKKIAKNLEKTKEEENQSEELIANKDHIKTCSNEDANNQVILSNYNDYQKNVAKLEEDNNRIVVDSMKLFEKTPEYKGVYKKKRKSNSISVLIYTPIKHNKAKSCSKSLSLSSEKFPVDKNLSIKNKLTSKKNSKMKSKDKEDSHINTLKLTEKINTINKLKSIIKEKDLMINSLTFRLDKSTEEVFRLKERLNTYKFSNVKQEIDSLNNSLKVKEDLLNSKNLYFEQLAKEYKEKINSLINQNNNSLKNIKEINLINTRIFEENTTMKNNISILEKKLVNIEKEIFNLKDSLEEQTKQKNKSIDEFTNQENKLKGIISLLKDNYEENKILIEKYKIVKDKISLVFTENYEKK